MFRIIGLFVKSLFLPKLSMNDNCMLTMRVWPTDMDLNFHMNNAKYLTIGTIARIWYARRTGLLGQIRKASCGLVIVGTHITYHKSLLPFATYQISTEMIGADENWFYFEHKFKKKEKLVARLVVRMVFIKSGKRLSSEEAKSKLGLSVENRLIDLEISKKMDPVT